MTMNKIIRTKCRYCDIDGCLGACLRKDATRAPADSVPAGAGYAELPDYLICAVDQWFADNIKDSDGCTTQDVSELAEIFYGVTHEGGRESVDDALAIVKSFGPGIGGINDTYARQVLLAEEVERLRGQATNAKKTGELLMGLAVIRELTGTQQKGLEETIEAVRAAVNAQKTSASTSQPGGFDAGDMASAAAQGYRDGWTAAQAISAEPAGVPAATVIKRGADREWMSERLGHLPDGPQIRLPVGCAILRRTQFRRRRPRLFLPLRRAAQRRRKCVPTASSTTTPSATRRAV